jgi:lipopolysaccharide transport system ATP-binding protein
MKPIIEVHAVSKKYMLHANRANYHTLRESIISCFSNTEKHKELWALKDISFVAEAGEAIGIIGENGAGKTTLLKILSRIVPPTKGKAIVRGKVSSLLEVGTGFHPELTGLENIYLNGSILGLSHKEIEKHLDSILAFAEIKDFINTPLKHYSTGMWARLAFSIAAHLSSEILLIDEVLSVGDSEFQQKSIGRMHNILNQGRTVLFVSHNMAAVRKLCNKCILLSQGEIKKIGSPDEIIETYLSKQISVNQGSIDLTNYTQRQGNQKVRLTRIELRNQEDKITATFDLMDDLHIHLFIEPSERIRKVKVTVDIREADGNRVCNIFDSDSGFSLRDISIETHVSLTIKDLRFYPGKYIIGVEIESEIFSHKADLYDYIPICISFNMINHLVCDRLLRRCDGLLYLTPEWHVHE